ncbi:MAG TPA: sugar phosphate isomerase/epimerase family protein [Tepidisphaeraceae bacterium]|jgi:fatty-acyl-CoA synthase
MKLTVSTLACPDWTLAQILEACASAGVGGVDFRGLGGEIDITRLREFTLDLPATLAMFRERNVELPCFATSVTLISPSAQRWQEMLDEAHRYAQLAARTGTRFIRIFGGAIPRGVGRDEALAMARRHLRQVAKIGRTHGTLPVVETHDAWCTSAAARELLHEFDPAEAAVLWDVEHTCRAGEAPGETAEALRRYIRHVHLKDSVRDDEKYVPKLLGEGDLPLADAIRSLNAIGYDGWVCLETERRWHPDLAPAPEVSLPHFARFMAGLA